jgi:hypothetical protein
MKRHILRITTGANENEERLSELIYCLRIFYIL